VWSARRAGLEPIRMTFWDRGRRATAPAPPPSRPRIVVVGGSFTQGWAVSDAETFAWRLQREFPDFAVENFGTAGYGTYQSLLALEAELARAAPPVAAAVYGFADFHEKRNVAAPDWIRRLAQSADEAAARVPYATLDAAGGLVRHPPLGYPAWPLAHRSALVDLLQARGAELAGAPRSSQARPVTRRLLVEMQRRCDEGGVPLLVAVLAQNRAYAAREYLRFLARSGIRAVDCTHPDASDPSMMVPGYGHPNARMNAHWATCAGDALRALLRGAGPTPRPRSPRSGGGAPPR
jgi:hypothetical protein